MGMIKDRNGKDLTKAEEIKKRWKKYTELYKKGFNDLDNHNGVVTHLEPDILESEVKALGSITTNKLGEVMELQLSWNPLKSQKTMLLKCCTQCVSQLENLAVATGLKRAFLMVQKVKNLPAMQETWVQSLSLEDPLENEMATHSSILAWGNPRTEEPGGLQSMGSQRVGHD